ncbi:MAG: MBL fold metallo-hydrolase [bacterium]
MRLTFWGTRGAITSPGPAKFRYGANTACVSFHSGEQMLILDAGIGIIPLSERIMAARKPREKLDLHLILSHLHWDHVIGLPFFTPVFFPSTQLDIYGRRAEEIALATDRLFTSTYSPIKGTANLGATLNYRTIETAASDVGGFKVTPCNLRHPGGALAFRIEADDQVVVYASDHEFGDQTSDELVTELARGAQVLIHDAQWTRSECKSFSGYGHSSWEGAVTNALQAGVKTLVLFHHHPHHDDETLDEMGRCAAERAGDRLEVLVARDGLLLDP